MPKLRIEYPTHLQPSSVTFGTGCVGGLAELPDLDSTLFFVSGCEAVRERLHGMGIEEVLTSPRSPWQNGFVERLIGSVRREGQSSKPSNNRPAWPNCSNRYHAETPPTENVSSNPRALPV